MVKEFPKVKSLLIGSDQQQKTTAAVVIASFETKFSDEGSNARIHEETIMAHFVRYLRKVEGGNNFT